MTAELPTVVLVDDHELFRAGVRAELEGLADVRAEAGNVEEAANAILRERPDVVLLDVHMPGGGGVEVIRHVAQTLPAQRFLALSVSDAAEDVIAVIRAGARGYVTKSISGEELADAIRRVRDGDAVFSPRLAGFVLDTFQGEIPEAEVDPELDRLTLREREVLRLIARGYQYKEIALRLSISHKTVEAHVSAVLRKLQLCNRHELSRWAAERRLVDQPPASGDPSSYSVEPESSVFASSISSKTASPSTSSSSASWTAAPTTRSSIEQSACSPSSPCSPCSSSPS
jgi:DNA-binding NarL/FixJ family response regulator